jgi:hypothetical protein
MVAYAQEILLDVADAVELTKGEEITLMYWGNAIVKDIQKDSAGKVTQVVGELHLEGDPKTTAKKLHWLAKVWSHFPALTPRGPLSLTGGLLPERRACCRLSVRHWQPHHEALP